MSADPGAGVPANGHEVVVLSPEVGTGAVAVVPWNASVGRGSSEFGLGGRCHQPSPAGVNCR